MMQARVAMARRRSASMPWVRAMNRGTRPGGSITTKKVTKAEMNNSLISALQLPARAQQEIAEQAKRQIKPDQHRQAQQDRAVCRADKAIAKA